MEEIMKRAFWDLLTEDLSAKPPRHNHFLKLMKEVQERLVRICAKQKSWICDVIDVDFMKDRFENGTADGPFISGIVSCICMIIKECCAPADDKDVQTWIEECQEKNPEDLIQFFPWFIESVHQWVDKIEEGVREFYKLVKK